MKKSDKYWEEIDMLLGGNEHARVVESREEIHDRVIDQHISHEIQQSIESVDNNGGRLPRVAGFAKHAWRRLRGRIFTDAGVRQLGYAVILLGVLGYPLYWFANSQSGVSPGTVKLPNSAALIATVSTQYIDHSKESYSLVKAQPSEQYKAFLTGVLHTDSAIYHLAGQQVPQDLYLLYSSKISDKPDASSEQAHFERALDHYSHTSSHATWFDMGRAVEFVFLAASAAMETYQDSALKDALSEYARVTSNVVMDGQSDRLALQHRKLISLSDEAALTPDNIEDIQEYTRNIKVLIR